MEDEQAVSEILDALVLNGEQWLLERWVGYARSQDYTRYTSTLLEAWRASIKGISAALLQSLSSGGCPGDFGASDSFVDDPASAFGIMEARRHRERGVDPVLFLGLGKYMRQSYRELVELQGFDPELERGLGQCIDRFFDRFELSIIQEWASLTADARHLELERANRQMTNEKNLYLTLFESQPTPTLFLSPEGDLVSMNRAAACTFIDDVEPGSLYYSREEVRLALPWLAALVERAHGGELSGFLEALPTRQGRAIFEIHLAPMLDVSERNRGTVLHLVDVTERERASAELGRARDELEQRVLARTSELASVNERLRQQIHARERVEAERESTRMQLLQAQKLEAVGSLASGVAHDLNNVLQVVQTCTELLRVGERDTALKAELERAIERAGRLVRQLLVFSRRQPVQFKTVRLDVLVRELAVLLDRLLGEQHVLSLSADPGLGPVVGDQATLEQVVLNLVVNARDALPMGGDIIIRVSQQGPWACLEVKDNGKGMSEATLKRAFEPFYTTKGAGGSGLGLAIVRDVVGRHEGEIEVQSSPGEGSRFTIRFPVAAPASLQEQVSVATPSREPGAPLSILLVEDETMVRRMVERVLKRAGHSVVSASCLDEGRTLWELHKAELDVLLSDVVLPDGRGPTLAAQLYEECPDLAVLFMSGYAPEDEALQSMLAVGASLVHKPFKISELLTEVEAVSC